MKKLLFLLFAGICLPFSVAFGQQQTYVQERPPQLSNLWGVKSVGVYGNFGGEKFFEPLTFDYFNRNSGYKFPQYFVLPPGAGSSQPNPLYDQRGGGLELAWPVGKSQNEIRVGLAIQDHHNRLSSTSYYHISPDTIRRHTIRLSDSYMISQASFDYVFYSKPVLKHFRFLWRLGSTFGVSTQHNYDYMEGLRDIPTANLYINPDGSIYDPWSGDNVVRYTSLDSSPRLEAGLRTSLGLELMLDFFHKEIGISGEYGHGLAGQKVLKGGTTDFKRTELKQIQIRYFLR